MKSMDNFGDRPQAPLLKKTVIRLQKNDPGTDSADTRISNALRILLNRLFIFPQIWIGTSFSESTLKG